MQPERDGRSKEPGHGQRRDDPENDGQRERQAALARIGEAARVEAEVVVVDQAVVDSGADHRARNGPDGDQDQVVAAEPSSVPGKAVGAGVRAGPHPAGAECRQHENDEDDRGQRQRLQADGQPERGDRRIEVEADHLWHGPSLPGPEGPGRRLGPRRFQNRRRAAERRQPECQLTDTRAVIQPLLVAAERWLDTRIGGLRTSSRTVDLNRGENRPISGESRSEGDRTGDRAGSGGRGVRDRRFHFEELRKPRLDGTAGASLRLQGRACDPEPDQRTWCRRAARGTAAQRRAARRPAASRPGAERCVRPERCALSRRVP